MKEIPDEGAVLTSMKKFVEYVVLGWLQILLNNVYNDNILSVVSGKNICENIWSVMWWFHYREANLGLLLWYRSSNGPTQRPFFMFCLRKMLWASSEHNYPWGFNHSSSQKKRYGCLRLSQLTCAQFHGLFMDFTCQNWFKRKLQNIKTKESIWIDLNSKHCQRHKRPEE